MKTLNLTWVVFVFMHFSLVNHCMPQDKPFQMIDYLSLDFQTDEDWGRYQPRRLYAPDNIHMDEPPGWTTFDAVYTDRDGLNRMKYGWQVEETAGFGQITDWYMEWKINIDPFSIGQGCMTEFHYNWREADPDAHPDFQEPGKTSVDFSLGYFHRYLTQLDVDFVWLCGPDKREFDYNYFADAAGWSGVPIIMRLRKCERTMYFEAKKEEDTEFTIIYQMPCNIYSLFYYIGWSLSTTGEWGATPSNGLPWSGMAQYFRTYTNAELPQYSVNFSESDSLGPFIIFPGTESEDHYSFTENPGWLRIHTEYASAGITTAKNQLIEPFAPNLMADFYAIVRLQQEPKEAGQGFGMKLTFLTTEGTKEAVCYWGKGGEELVGYYGGDFFAAGLKGEELLTDAANVRGPIFLRIARVGAILYIEYSMSGSSTTGYRRLATIPAMEGGLLNLMLAAGNYGQWGATEVTGSIPVDIRSIDIREKTIDVKSYYTMDNEFNNGLEPFVIPQNQEDSEHYSLDARLGFYRIQTQYHAGALDGAKNVLKQTFTEPITSGISIVTRVDLEPVEDGQVFGIQLGCQCDDGVFRNALLRFGKAPSSVTGGYSKFLEYGYEGRSEFIDASSISGVIILRIERFADRFLFSYAVDSETEYTMLGSVGGGTGLIKDVLFGAANLSDYGATDQTPSMTVDVDYFRSLQNLIANGQCEFTMGDMPWPWKLSNVDSTAFSLTEREGWLKVMTRLNPEFQGRISMGPNAVRAAFGDPHPGIEGDFDFTMMMEGQFDEPGQVMDIVLGAETSDFIFRYGLIGEGETVPKFQVGVDSVQAELVLTDPDSVLMFRILRQDSTIRFMYLPWQAEEWIQIAKVDSGVEATPVRNATVVAQNVVAFGATEATSSATVYFDYIRFNRIDDFLTSVDERYVMPDEYELSQNYPNPFNSGTAIQYRLPKATDVNLEIYNIIGQRVRTLVDKKQMAGRYTIIWDGENDVGLQAASGMYLTLFRAGEMRITRKMILLK